MTKTRFVAPTMSSIWGQALAHGVVKSWRPVPRMSCRRMRTRSLAECWPILCGIHLLRVVQWVNSRLCSQYAIPACTI
jgi:hypothetical protein